MNKMYSLNISFHAFSDQRQHRAFFYIYLSLRHELRESSFISDEAVKLDEQ